jgi:hypothetical protein
MLIPGISIAQSIEAHLKKNDLPDPNDPPINTSVAGV